MPTILKKTGLVEARQLVVKSDLDDSMTSQLLPHELVVEILSWVPIKYLCPFRYVCKTWLQLLTRDPLFAKLHFDRSIQLKSSPSIVVKKDESKLYYMATDHTTCDNAIPLQLPFQDQGIRYTVYGICNGLLCLSSMYKAEVYIWNPITNHHITIPYSLTPSRIPGLHRDTRVAFGFHPGTNEYKVIKISWEYKPSQTQFHSEVSVYTLGLDSSWRTLVDNIPYRMLHRSTDCPLINGSIHLLSSRTSSFAILAFDLKDESFREIPPPKEVNFEVDLSTYNRIAELGDQLCMFCGHYRRDVQIWVMNEYGVADSWRKLFTIGRPEVGGLYICIELLCIVSHSGDIILRKNLIDVILYHPRTSSISYLTNIGFEICDAYTYIGSIISPRVISRARDTMT